MNWIDVNEDLPPKGASCLVYAKVATSFNPRYMILEAKCDPSKGWRNDTLELEVYCWCCPEGLNPPAELIKRLTSEECQAACDSQDEYQ
jgi:hypothetical protein